MDIFSYLWKWGKGLYLSVINFMSNKIKNTAKKAERQSTFGRDRSCFVLSTHIFNFNISFYGFLIFLVMKICKSLRLWFASLGWLPSRTLRSSHTQDQPTYGPGSIHQNILILSWSFFRNSILVLESRANLKTQLKIGILPIPLLLYN